MEPTDGAAEPTNEEALRRRVAELSRVQRIGRIGGFEIDLRGGQFSNHRSPEYLSVPRLDADAAREAHEAWVQRIHPEDRERAEVHFKNCVTGNARNYSSEYRIVLPDLGVRWISAVAEIDRDENGAPLRMVGVHIDITRTKEAETALRASELAIKESQQRLRDLNTSLEKLAEERASQLANSRALLQAFFDNSPDWLTLQRCKPDGGFIYEDINPTCEKAYGLPRSLVIGRRVEDILGEEGARIPLANFRECLRSGQPQRYVTHRTMAGVTRYIDVVSVLVPGAHDKEDRFLLTTARDLTEREQMETQIRQSQRMDAIGQLTGGVAHDFNNLLTIILGNAALLKKGTAREPARLIDNILSAAERGGALTRQLLSMARNRPLTRQVVDLTTHMPRMNEMLRACLRGDIELRVATAPSMVIEADIGELEIALLNVAVNARDAMPSGGVFTVKVQHLGSECHPAGLSPSPRGFVVITMSDNGIGMPPETAGRAFEPFFTTKQLGVGTGLGLSQVIAFAQGSGGTVTLQSEIGLGTEVAIILPAMALDRLTALPNHFDMLLTDVVMPGTNGVDLARQVRVSWPDLQVVLMSGYNDAPVPADFPVLRKLISCNCSPGVTPWCHGLLPIG
jgi:PAS domain S-box-containing protein